MVMFKKICRWSGNILKIKCYIFQIHWNLLGFPNIRFVGFITNAFEGQFEGESLYKHGRSNRLREEAPLEKVSSCLRTLLKLYSIALFIHGCNLPRPYFSEFQFLLFTACSNLLKNLQTLRPASQGIMLLNASNIKYQRRQRDSQVSTESPSRCTPAVSHLRAVMLRNKISKPVITIIYLLSKH